MIRLSNGSYRQWICSRECVGRLIRGPRRKCFFAPIFPEAPWFIIEGNDKKRARLNCMDHLLKQIPYAEVPHSEISLPQRVFDPNYERKVLPPELYVPQKY